MNKHKKEIVINGIYEHYKGKRYKVYGIVRHSESLEELVLYDCLYDNDLGKTWVRPKELFLGDVQVENQTKERFRYLDSLE